MTQQEIIDVLNAQLKDVSRFKVRDYGLEVLPRVLVKLYENQNSCIECAKFRHEGESYTYNVKLLFEDNKDDVKHFEDWAESTQEHLKKGHDLHPKGKQFTKYLLVGMLFGLLMGLISLFWVEEQQYFGIISLGWLLGSVFGWILGKYQEWKMQKQGRIY